MLCSNKCFTFLNKYRELLDYFCKKIPMSRFTGLSEKSFLKKKSGIWAKSMGSDAIALNFLKELESTGCSIRALERLYF